MNLALRLLVVLSVWASAHSVSAQSAACPLPFSADRIAPAAGAPGSGACVYYLTIPHLNYSRSFKLLVPDSYQPGPAHDRLVLDFHGYGSSKSNQLDTSCWKDKAIRDGFAVAYPNGTGFPVSFSAGDYCCDASPVRPARDDVQFAKDVAAYAKSLLHAGSSAFRVYASGLSNGGALAHNLACEAGDAFDGIAAVSQTFTRKPGHPCLNGREPIPVLDFRATQDSVIPYNGGPSAATLWAESWLSAADSRARWFSELGCGSAVVRKDYTGGSYCLRMDCAADFVQCTIAGPHVLYERAASHGVDVCEAAWELFGEQAGSVLPGS